MLVEEIPPRGKDGTFQSCVALKRTGQKAGVLTVTATFYILAIQNTVCSSCQHMRLPEDTSLNIYPLTT